MQGQHAGAAAHPSYCLCTEYKSHNYYHEQVHSQNAYTASGQAHESYSIRKSKVSSKAAIGWAGWASNTLHSAQRQKTPIPQIGILYLLPLTEVSCTSNPDRAGREHNFSANSMFMTSTAEKYHFSACPVLHSRYTSTPHTHTPSLHIYQSPLHINKLPCRGSSTSKKHSPRSTSSCLSPACSIGWQE